VQCDKRNNYRRRVKEEKAAAVTQNGDEAAADGANPAPEGAVNGHTTQDDTERPAKKQKGEDGTATLPDADQLDDDDLNGEQDDGQNGGDDPDDDVEDDLIEDEDDADEQDEQDETMEEPTEDLEDRGELRDEALDDEPDSD
jgi:DNA polymerase epsilon subunit 3